MCTSNEMPETRTIMSTERLFRKMPAEKTCDPIANHSTCWCTASPFQTPEKTKADERKLMLILKIEIVEPGDFLPEKIIRKDKNGNAIAINDNKHKVLAEKLKTSI